MSWGAWLAIGGAWVVSLVVSMRWAYYLGMSDTERRWSAAVKKADANREWEKRYEDRRTDRASRDAVS